MIARLDLKFPWASDTTFLAPKASYARSANASLGNLGSINERIEVDSLNKSAEGTNPSDPSVLLHALAAKFDRNSILYL